jgi:hypothetical protein
MAMFFFTNTSASKTPGMYKTIAIWLKQHASAVFIAILFIAGGGLAFHGGYLKVSTPPNTPISLYAEIAFQVGSALLILAITSVLFSLGDLKDTLAAGIASLFSRGDIVPILSAATKKTLHRRLTDDRISSDVAASSDDLYLFLTALSDEVAASVHAHDLHIHKTVGKVTVDGKDLYSYTTLLSYDLVVEHLHSESATVPIRYGQQTTFQHPAPILIKDWFKVLKIEIGAETFDLAAAVIEEQKDGGETTFQMSFDHKVTFQKRIEVRIRSEILSPKPDSIEFLVTRYPTKRFSGSLNTASGFACRALWLASAPSSERAKSIQCAGSSCTALTKSWLLPGEGVVIYVDQVTS